MSGNLLGAKSYYLYVDDAGASYSFSQDVDLAAAAGNTLDATHGPMPRRFKPRIAYVQDNEGHRKAIVCGSIDSPLYAQNVTNVTNIDGAPFFTTGRHGERFSVASNGIAGPPAP
jgi:hypothetical protein